MPPTPLINGSWKETRLYQQEFSISYWKIEVMLVIISHAHTHTHFPTLFLCDALTQLSWFALALLQSRVLYLASERQKNVCVWTVTVARGGLILPDRERESSHIIRIVKLIFLQNCHKYFFMTSFLPISFAYVSRVHTLIQPPLNVTKCVMQAIKCSSVYAANERLANRAAVFIAGCL